MYLLCLDILFNFLSSKCLKFSFEFHEISFSFACFSLTISNKQNNQHKTNKNRIIVTDYDVDFFLNEIRQWQNRKMWFSKILLYKLGDPNRWWYWVWISTQ